MYKKALEYYSKKQGIDIQNEYTDKYQNILVHCYQKKKDLSTFDAWSRFCECIGQNLSYDEYLVVASFFDGNPHDVELNDTKTIKEWKNRLYQYHTLRYAILQRETNINTGDIAVSLIQKGTEPELTKAVNYCSFRSKFNPELQYYLCHEEHLAFTQESLQQKFVSKSSLFEQIH